MNTTQTPQLSMLLIDMQPSFLKRMDEMELDTLISSQVDVLRFCARYDVPVIVLEYDGEGRTIWGLEEEVKRVPRYQIVTKPKDDGFIDTHLDYILKEWQITNLCLMGVNASGCVRDTAESALDRNIEIITAEQLIADPYLWNENKSIDFFNQNGNFLTDYKKMLECGVWSNYL